MLGNYLSADVNIASQLLFRGEPDVTNTFTFQSRYGAYNITGEKNTVLHLVVGVSKHSTQLIPVGAFELLQGHST